MDFEYLIIGFVFIISGIALIIGYEKIKQKNRSSGLTFKLRVGGIGFVIIGVYLIITELIKI